MKITMLGTGNAWVKECYNTCFVLSQKEQHFLVDCGGGNRIMKVLQDARIDLQNMHDLFVTHAHTDHVLGVVWVVRLIGTMMKSGKYEGTFRIYCHEGLESVIQSICQLTLPGNVMKYVGERIVFVPLQSGDSKEIIGCRVTFFDIYSVKMKQFGFTLELPEGKKIACCGDEPYNEAAYSYIEGSDYLLHEAFCLFTEADRFKPYEKNHTTVKEACQIAQQLAIPNLILYHTEEENLSRRKELYMAEGKEYYSGNLYVPDDLDVIEIEIKSRNT